MIFGKPKYLRAILLTKEGDHSHKEIGLLFGQSFSMKYNDKAYTGNISGH